MRVQSWSVDCSRNGIAPMKSDKLDFDSRVNFGNLESNLLFLEKAGLVNENVEILEIGSGVGSLLSYYVGKGYNIQGVEISRKLIDRSKTVFGELPLHHVDSEILPFDDGSFDIVLSFDVFEHIPDSDSHLSEVRRVLRNNGYYLLQTPNKLTNTVFETIRWKSLTSWREDHCSLHTYWALSDRFRKNGFDVEFYRIPVVTDFFIEKVRRHLGAFGVLLIKLVNPDTLPLMLRTNFYVVARKM